VRAHRREHTRLKNPSTHLTTEQKRIRTVPEQYQTTPENPEKTRPNPKSNEKNRPHPRPREHRGGVKNKLLHTGARARVENGIKSPKYRHNRLHLSTGSRRRADDAFKRIVLLSTPHAPGLHPEPPTDHSTPNIKITEPARRTLPRNNNAQHTINILSRYNYPGLTILLQPNPPANTDHVVSAEDI
jgi:hypothetical protein